MGGWVPRAGNPETSHVPGGPRTSRDPDVPAPESPDRIHEVVATMRVMPPTPDPGVVVTVPARAEFAHVLRTVVASVGSRRDLSYDDLDDLRIAIDEACAYLLDLGATAGSITMRVVTTEEGIEATVTIDGDGGSVWPPDRLDHSLAWQVLSGLSDEVRFERSGGMPSIRVVKRGPIA